jgi:hypothetical protein
VVAGRPGVPGMAGSRLGRAAALCEGCASRSQRVGSLPAAVAARTPALLAPSLELPSCQASPWCSSTSFARPPLAPPLAVKQSLYSPSSPDTKWNSPEADPCRS